MYCTIKNVCNVQLYSVQYTVYIIQYTEDTTLYSVQCTPYSVQFTLYIAQCISILNKYSIHYAAYYTLHTVLIWGSL